MTLADTPTHPQGELILLTNRLFCYKVREKRIHCQYVSRGERAHTKKLQTLLVCLATLRAHHLTGACSQLPAAEAHSAEPQAAEKIVPSHSELQGLEEAESLRVEDEHKRKVDLH